MSFLKCAWILAMFLALFLPVGLMVAVLLMVVVPFMLLTTLLAMPFTWAAHKLGIIKENPITVTYHHKDRVVIYNSEDKQ